MQILRPRDEGDTGIFGKCERVRTREQERENENERVRTRERERESENKRARTRERERESENESAELMLNQNEVLTFSIKVFAM